MAQIKLELSGRLIDGMDVKFKAPCDCTEVTGLLVSYVSDSGSAASKSFTFRDAHGNDLAGLGDLFASGAYIKAVLDTVNGRAYIQNADTNAYLEGKFNEPITTDKLGQGSVTGSKIAQKAIVPFSYSLNLPKSKWTLNDYGLYEQTVILDMTSIVAPDTHIGFLGHTRGLMHYPAENSTTWVWSQEKIKSDKKNLSCIYSAKIIAENTINFVATKIPDGTVYVTIVFVKR